jgi:hypothetical protein
MRNRHFRRFRETSSRFPSPPPSQACASRRRLPLEHVSPERLPPVAASLPRACLLNAASRRHSAASLRVPPPSVGAAACAARRCNSGVLYRSHRGCMSTSPFRPRDRRCASSWRSSVTVRAGAWSPRRGTPTSRRSRRTAVPRSLIRSSGAMMRSAAWCASSRAAPRTTRSHRRRRARRRQDGPGGGPHAARRAWGHS